MIRKHFRFKRIALGFAFAAVVAAVLAPSATARYQSEISVQPTVTPLQADGLRWQAMANYYQDKAAGRQPVASEMSVQSTITPLQAQAMRWEAMAKFYSDNKPAPVSATGSGSDGFSWSDAGIGASVTFAALLLLGTAVGVGRKHRTRGLASA